jgi:hypothetical protein
MSDFNSTDQSNNPQRPFAFCQTCGTPLDNETARRVGPAVYCEPCLDARLHAAPPPPPGTMPGAAFPGTDPIPAAGPAAAGYGPVNTGAPPVGGPFYGAPGYAGSNYAGGFPPIPGEPNPGTAALLGLIPGVGAMYNEQYAKGIAHLLIFSVLVLLSHASGIFSLFVLGWICYMSIEAHHTARARRDGTPLPNPFGFNDIGERMGFGKAWPNSPDVVAAARAAVDAAAAGINSAAAGFAASRPANMPPANTPSPGWGSPIITPPPAGTPMPGTPVAGAAPGASAPGWGAPVDAYPPYSAPRSYSQSYAYTNPAMPPAYSETFVPPAGAVPPIPPIPPAPRFPMGAVLLIGFGMLFLLGTLGIFNAVPGSALLGVTFLVLGVWIFLRRMMETGLSFTDDGTPGYQMRLLRALRGSVWLIALGVFSLLDSFRLVSWSSSWPWFIILAGVMMLLQRTVYNHAAAHVQTAPPVVPNPPAPSNSPSGSASSSASGSASGPDFFEGGK